MRNDSALGGRKERKKKKKTSPGTVPQTCGEMYVLEKMTQRRALIAVMTRRQPHGFHKMGTSVSARKECEKKKQKRAEVWNKFTAKVFAAKLPHHVRSGLSRVMGFTFAVGAKSSGALLKR